jgi:urease alpha subunit
MEAIGERTIHTYHTEGAGACYDTIYVAVLILHQVADMLLTSSSSADILMFFHRLRILLVLSL